MIKILKVLFGISLLIFAIGAAVGVYLSSGSLKLILIDGRPVVCPLRGGELQVPGRLVATVLFGVPVVSLLGAWLTLTSALQDSEKKQSLEQT